MVHFNATEPQPDVTNMPHQHVFFIVGHKPMYGVHMTQYHCEIHKYQLIIEFELPEHVTERLESLRREFPNDSFILANADNDQMTVPDLASLSHHNSSNLPGFKGNIFQGFRPFEEGEVVDEHTFPWKKERCNPAIAEFEVTIKRIVMFRPFSHQEKRPPYPSFLIWGENGEAHMTNLQTAALQSGKFEPNQYGPDFDTVLSLKEAPKWVEPGLLKAGIVVSVPKIDMKHPHEWPVGPLFKKGEAVQTMYRGLGPARKVIAGPTFLAGTAVCNSPGADPHHGANLYISIMPSNYHVDE